MNWESIVIGTLKISDMARYNVRKGKGYLQDIFTDESSFKSHLRSAQVPSVLNNFYSLCCGFAANVESVESCLTFMWELYVTYSSVCVRFCVGERACLDFTTIIGSPSSQVAACCQWRQCCIWQKTVVSYLQFDVCGLH